MQVGAAVVAVTGAMGLVPLAIAQQGGKLIAVLAVEAFLAVLTFVFIFLAANKRHDVPVDDDEGSRDVRSYWVDHPSKSLSANLDSVGRKQGPSPPGGSGE